tara:strand:+ start:40 stop:1368 length:1329 start_codon:yes stop_codon:yes gene_type:complete
MAVQLTYTGTPFADQIKQQGFKAGKTTGGFGLRLADLFQGGPKTFTTPNFGVASLYGKTIPVVSSMSNLRLPSGAIPGKTLLESLKNIGGTKFGTEVIQTPKQATKGMDFASKLGTKYTGSRARDLLAGKTVTGLGGASTAPGILRSIFSLPMSAVTLGPQLIAAGMTPRTEAGFDFMKGFDKGAITSISDETAGLDYQDFGTGIMQADAAATQKAALEAARMDPNVVAAIDAQTADEQAQLPIDPVDNRNIFSRFKDFVSPTVKDVAGRTIASQTLGKAGAMIDPYLGLAGLIFGGLKGGNLFNAPYIEGVTTFDPITGQLISGEELDKLNARGGYYTDVARAARRRDRSIANMKARRDAGLRYGANRLKELEEQAAKEEAARQAEFDRIMSSEASQKTFYDSLNEGRGATSTAESRATAGDAPGYTGPSPFAKGGIVGLL